MQCRLWTGQIVYGARRFSKVARHCAACLAFFHSSLCFQCTRGPLARTSFALPFRRARRLLSGSRSAEWVLPSAIAFRNSLRPFPRFRKGPVTQRAKACPTCFAVDKVSEDPRGSASFELDVEIVTDGVGAASFTESRDSHGRSAFEQRVALGCSYLQTAPQMAGG